MRADKILNFEDIVLLTPIEDNKSYFDKGYERKVFSELAISFISTFSESILKIPNVKLYPDLVSLAFWMRKSNISRLKKEFIEKNKGKIRVPVGRVIHFAPSNVDTIFIYSLFVSLLVGNTNIVRVSTKSSFQKDTLVELLNTLLKKSEFKVLQTSLSIITYPHSESVTSLLCSKVDMRVIWGGDETVKQISSCVLPPTATEIKFANKYSFSILNAEYISDLADNQFDKLINDFVNDSYWFGQQGCSSPRTIIWLNKDGHHTTIDAFWKAVAIKSEDMFSEDVVSADIMNKIVAASLCAVNLESCQVINTGRMLTRVCFSDIHSHNKLRDLHCGSGLFLECHVDSFENLKHIVDRKSQTISYFGFDVELLKSEFIDCGIFPDRVVPLGESLNFSVTWDGYDLFQSMTRTVDFV